MSLALETLQGLLLVQIFCELLEKDVSLSAMEQAYAQVNYGWDCSLNNSFTVCHTSGMVTELDADNHLVPYL